MNERPSMCDYAAPGGAPRGRLWPAWVGLAGAMAAFVWELPLGSNLPLGVKAAGWVWAMTTGRAQGLVLLPAVLLLAVNGVLLWRMRAPLARVAAAGALALSVGATVIGVCWATAFDIGS